MTNHQSIHEQAVRAARAYKKSQHGLLLAIQEVDRKRVYQKFGYKNLYDYCLKCLLLSEGTTYALIRVARKSMEIPEIQRAIGDGTLTLSHAKTILPVIKPENKDEWIGKAKALSVRRLENEVARQNTDCLIREKLKVVSKTRVKLECGLDPETSELIQRAKELLSQKTGKSVNLENALKLVFLDYLKRHDPLKKVGRLSTWPKNKNLTKAMKEARLRIDNGRCQGKDPSGPCHQERWLDIHHQKPVSQGGSHDIANLITLCKDHHKLQHRTI